MGGREGTGGWVSRGVRGRVQGEGLELGAGGENLHWVKLWEVAEEEEEEVEDSHSGFKRRCSAGSEDGGGGFDGV